MSTPDRRGTDPRIVGAIVAAVLGLAIVVTVGLLTAGRDRVAVGGDLTATPIMTVDPSSPGADPAPPTAQRPSTSGPTPPVPALPVPAPQTMTPRPADPDGGGPTDDDIAVFVHRVAGEGGQAVRVDLDDDAADEVVVAGIRGGRSHIVVGDWTGAAFRDVGSGEGGSAEEIADVVVDDITGPPATHEVVVRQRSGTQGESVSLWRIDAQAVTPLTAIGGCWDGSHTYGIVGADVEDANVVATCDGSPLPVVAWSSDVYGWDAEMQAFTYVSTTG